MKPIKSTCCILLAAFLLFPGISKSQFLNYSAGKEKVYLHTNHVFFKPGEQLFFKLYLVNAKDQTPSAISSSATVEVLNPSGNVIKKMNYQVGNGYAEGSFDFDENAVGGIYKLRAYTNWMLNEKDSSFFVKEITLQKLLEPRILMKLDFPRKGYGAGDEVSADFSMRNLADQPIKNHNVKFTVSLAGEVVQTGNFKTSAEGKSKVKFLLPQLLKSNDGLLNITVEYDSYTEGISRSIPIVLNKIDLQFMPEGGTLINGIPTNIAFKALNENGKAADIKGAVWDDKGNKVVDFESFHFGMGKFSFTPVNGRTYRARISSPANIQQQFSLPEAADEGIVMNISKTGHLLNIKITSTGRLNINLLGETKSVNYFSKNMTLHKGENLVTLDEDLFPAGIARFTLYTADELPLAERICFLNEDKKLQVKITTDKKKYLPREKVNLTIETKDENGRAVPSNFSLSVVDDKLWTLADDKQENILSWLLMSSELKGKIEEPQFYFKKEEPDAVPALDLVMLTHGYRYFDYTEEVITQGRLKYMPDQDNVLSGIILNEQQEPVKATVFFINPNEKGSAVKITTDEDGSFFFSELTPGAQYYLVAKSLKNKEKISIRVLSNGLGFNPSRSKQLKLLTSAPRDFPDQLPIKRIPKGIPVLVRKEPAAANFAMFNREDMKLNEVVVIGYGSVKRKSLTGSVAMIQAKEIENAGDVKFMLQGKVAGLQVVEKANPGAAADIRLRGAANINANAEPLLVIDGEPMSRFDLNININNIEAITVLKDQAATAVFGSRGSNGVILIDLKKNKQEKLRINLTKKYYYSTEQVFAAVNNYTAARKFYAPQYVTTQTDTRNDFRETIYWNPVVQTDKNGLATVSFYNSDASTTFRAIAEGVGYNGKLGREEATYYAQNAISADAKIPPCLTVSDKAMLPLVIKNNRTENTKITVFVETPAGLKTGNFTGSFTLAPDSSRQLLIPVEVMAPVKGTIRFDVSTSFGREKLELPVTAVENGFPVIETFSGQSSAHNNFLVNKMVPGTLKAELKLFKSVEGQLLDGIESMLREPGGCFEQTSSSTYPNIYILKYLKEAGKSNPDIEQKALGYIQNGYKRLVGFETAQNGFEWFGKTPPHESLTAYGLLEFTDMQEFVNVDKEMLARTKAFLMSRRDGKGQFTLAHGGYDQFASVPDKIANIYIVYALTQAGIGNEIIPEYEAAVKKALESKDGYQLAMMALAASNLKNDKDFEILLEKLKTVYQEKNLASETSVVNSRDASLRVESMSLYALALMREKTPSLIKVSEAITKILSEKSYYGYGSTQATVLALNAVVQYAKLLGKPEQNGEVQFTINDKPVTESKYLAGVLGEGRNSFSVNYSNSKKAIPYSMEVAYYTFTPPNSEKADLKITTALKELKTRTGETVRMDIEVRNTKSILQPMAIAKIGIPAGLSAQPWQLKELMEKNKVAYYETFDNYLVLYWMGFAGEESKKISLDLKAETPGTYTGKASNACLYYTPEHKNWNEGLKVEVLP